MSDPPTFRAPPLENTAAWTRMLAAARGADTLKTGIMPEVDQHPLLQERMDALGPVVRELYDEFVRPMAQSESQRVTNVLERCHAALEAMKSISVKAKPKPGANEQWELKVCQKEAFKLLVPAKLQTLRPAPPDVISLQLIPRWSPWQPIRKEINGRLKQPEKDLRKIYSAQVQHDIRDGILKRSSLHRLRGKFVNAVLKRAPPLVRAFPPQWTAADTTDGLHDALQALLKLPRTPPLAHLVDELSEREYAVLVEEHACLSQVLDNDAWERDCAKGRSLGHYQAFVRFLRYDWGFDGALAGVPPKKLKASKARRRPEIKPGSLLAVPADSTGEASPQATRPHITAKRRRMDDDDALEQTAPKKSQRISSAQPQVAGRLRKGAALETDAAREFDTVKRLGLTSLSFPSPRQKDTAGWTRLVAAARDADQALPGRALKTIPDTMIERRQLALVPIARALYEKLVLPHAEAESRQIRKLFALCRDHLDAKDELGSEREPHDEETWIKEEREQHEKETWTKDDCESHARELLVPFNLNTLRPTPAGAVGLELIPKSPLWQRVAKEILACMPPDDKRLREYYRLRLRHDHINRHFKQLAVNPLQGVRFVDIVRFRAPPLVRALPPQWTAAGMSSKLLEALQALLQVRHTQTLSNLVKVLTPVEYSLLVEEHFCLSQILRNDPWTPSCHKRRSLGGYEQFARFLRKYGSFSGVLADVPPQPQRVKRANHKAKVLRSNEPALSANLLLPVAPCDNERFPSVSGTSGYATAREMGGEFRQPTEHSAHAGILASHKVASASPVQHAAGEPPVAEDWELDMNELLNEDLGGYSDDELLEILNPRDPPDPAAGDAMNWAQAFPPLPSELENVATDWNPLWEPDTPSGAILQPKRSLSGESLERSNSVTALSGIPVILLTVVGSVAALGLVLLVSAALFRPRARRAAASCP